MIGLYLLVTTALETLKTIKFGMSMRLEYRWIDYLAVFRNSRYVYYYEFLDNLTREKILEIEDEIIQIHKHEENNNFQTEYFYCKDYDDFHKTIINVLNKRKINYKIHNCHDFDKKKYDNKPESFGYNKPVNNNFTPQYYQQEVLDKIEPFYKANNNFTPHYYQQEVLDKIEPFYKANNNFTPHYYQQEVLNKIEPFYKINNIANIIWACGLGKALLGIMIAQKINCKLVIIGVPSVYLQRQMKNEILKIFNNYKNILYVGGETEKNENYVIKSTTNKNEINNFVKSKTNECKFIITTYTSCFLLSDIHIFDFKIGDEAHHLVGTDSEKTKISFHKIKANKTLFMTATEKVIENNKTNKIIYSMDDKDIFGECIDTKSICWAIDNKKITDYDLIILKNTEDEIDKIIKSLNLKDDELQNSIIHHKDLFLSAFMSLKSIEKYDKLTHILIYTNTTENSELVKKYIDTILDLNIINISNNNYYNKAIHSNTKENLNDIKLSNGNIQEGELTKFKKASWGIISSVYIFGEGFDCPKLNGVVFADNMESEIRIVQSTLRPNRLDSNNPDKKAHVIIPYIDTENFMEDNKSFDKCRKIIAKIRNVDDKIEYKIKVESVKVLEKKEQLNNLKDKIKYQHVIENCEELTKIMLRLRCSKALDSKCSEEQDEYNYVQELNRELNIQDKEDYTNDKTIREKHKMYIKEPDEYFKSKGVWRNWHDFLGIDTKKFIQNKEDWINFCKEKNVKSLENYKEICKIYDELPKNPEDFYIDYNSFAIELKLITRRRI
jgi:superfamily II DNA or RNA helicase